MAFFQAESYDDKGHVIEHYRVEVSVGDVEKIMKHERVIKMKARAMNQGFAFRVRRLED